MTKPYQQATHFSTPYTFQSNLPVAGGYATGNYPTPGPMMLQVNVGGAGCCAVRGRPGGDARVYEVGMVECRLPEAMGGCRIRP